MLLRLYTLLLVFAVLWSSLAVFDAAGIVIFLIVLAAAAIVREQLWRLGFWMLVLLSVLVLAFMLFLPTVQSARENPNHMQCSNNLRQIAIALHNYHEANKCFPPAFIADKDGKPMHSWRVLILPYLGQRELYDQYDFNEPWNGPNNRKLLSARPSTYVCPSDEGARATGPARTSYVAIVGANAAWYDDKPRSLDDAEFRAHASTTNLLAETILLAETASAIDWTEPKDLSLDALQRAGASPDAVTVSSKHGCYGHDMFYDYEYDMPSGAFILLADGSTTFLGFWGRDVLVNKKFPDLLRIGGFKGDILDEIRDSSPYRQPQLVKATLRWRTCAALAVWIVSVALLLHRAWRSRKKPHEIVTS